MRARRPPRCIFVLFLERVVVFCLPRRVFCVDGNSLLTSHEYRFDSRTLWSLGFVYSVFFSERNQGSTIS